jgi:hypothetical protein
MRSKPRREDVPQRRPYRTPPGPVPTLGDLQAGGVDNVIVPTLMPKDAPGRA